MHVFRPHGRRPRRRGANLVEFALVAPVFFAFIFALVDIGRGMMVTSLLTNAARSGCRVGVLPNKTSTDVKSAVDTTTKGQGVGKVTTTVLVNGKSGDASSAKSGDAITVQVGIPYSDVTWLPSTWFVKGNLTGTFTLNRE
jgi:Flp pilus assembly protein TadG